MPLKVEGSHHFTKEWDPKSIDNIFSESVDIETFDENGNRLAVGKVYLKKDLYPAPESL